jgi:VWFA-related protein
MALRNHWSAHALFCAYLLALPLNSVRPESPSDAASTIRRSVEEVQVVFSALDAHGRPVAGMRPEAVSAYDDGQLVPQFTGFYASGDIPLRITLMVDVSESMKGVSAGQTAAASWLAARIVRPELDQFAVRTFAEDSTAVAARGTNSQLVQTALGSLHPSGQTALFDAMLRAITEVQHEQRDDTHPTRNVFLLLTDGDDNFSLHTLRDVIAAAERANIVVYTINAHNRRLAFPGDAVLQSLARSTGGKAFVLPTYSRVADIFPQLESEFGSQYTLTFRPPSATARGRWHTLRLEVHSPDKVEIHSRSDYYLSE